MRKNRTTKLFDVCLIGMFAVGFGGCLSSSAATIGGTVTGLPNSLTLLLVDNGSETISVTGSGIFTFNKKVEVGSTYSVTLFTQPTGSACSVKNGTGKVNTGAENITNVSVHCVPAAVALSNYNVGVTVSGLASGNHATFLNNGSDPLTVNENGLFVFPETYAMQSAPVGGVPGAYNVTISANPSGQTCTLTNAAGKLDSSNFSNFLNVIAICH